MGVSARWEELARETLSDDWALVTKSRLRFTFADGTSEEQLRQVYDRGDGAVILPYDAARGTAHFPALVTEMCGPIQPGGVLYSVGITSTSALGAVAISLIGFANIGGTLFASWLKSLLSLKVCLKIKKEGS